MKLEKGDAVHFCRRPLFCVDNRPAMTEQNEHAATPFGTGGGGQG
jgi:hypothetical protein